MKMLINTIFLLSFIWSICGGAGEEKEIIEAMKRHEVIPDVIDDGGGPIEILKIKFDSDAMVNQGDELTPTQVQNEPILMTWNNVDVNSYYTLIFTEPDAPTRSDLSLREWLHWLIVNIPGKDIAKGRLIFGYQGSGPGNGTGLHRYVYLMFKQLQKQDFDEAFVAADSIERRPKFSTRNFMAKYSLGNPIAANFYQAQYDEYSDVILSKLGLA